jgi:hypothetical protein
MLKKQLFFFVCVGGGGLTGALLKENLEKQLGTILISFMGVIDILQSDRASIVF